VKLGGGGGGGGGGDGGGKTTVLCSLLCDMHLFSFCPKCTLRV
jgi:hypothetical protein